MAVLSMPLAQAATQRKRMCFDKPCSRPLMAPVATAVAATAMAATAVAATAQAQPAAVSRKAMVDPGQEGPAALLVQATEGVRIVRRSAVLAARAGCMLQVGDRILVPAGGCAQAVFQEQDDQVLMGCFEGGTDASLAYFSRKPGACSVVFDLAAGHVDLALSAICVGPQGAAQEGAQDAAQGTAPGRRAIGFHCHSQAIAGR